MLRIRLIVVGKTKEQFLRIGESFYMERLRRYATTEWIEVKGAKIRKGAATDKVLEIEGDAIADRICSQDYVIALDRLGKDFTSEQLAGHIDQLTLANSMITFVIGGPLGLSKEVLGRARQVVSLSKMTLTHEMCRLVLLEQLYRAFTIIHGEKYHK